MWGNLISSHPIGDAAQRCSEEHSRHVLRLHASKNRFLHGGAKRRCAEEVGLLFILTITNVFGMYVTQTYEGHIAAVPMPIEARSSSRCQTMLKTNGFVDSLQNIVILALAEVAACFFV